MMMSTALRAAVVAGLLACSSAARADDAKPLKTEIESYIDRIEASAGGQLHWDGADTFEVKQSGDIATAAIANAHLSFRKHPGDQTPAFSVNLDRIEVRRAPAASGANLGLNVDGVVDAKTREKLGIKPPPPPTPQPPVPPKN